MTTLTGMVQTKQNDIERFKQGKSKAGKMDIAGGLRTAIKNADYDKEDDKIEKVSKVEMKKKKKKSKKYYESSFSSESEDERC